MCHHLIHYHAAFLTSIKINAKEYIYQLLTKSIGHTQRHVKWTLKTKNNCISYRNIIEGHLLQRIYEKRHTIKTDANCSRAEASASEQNTGILTSRDIME